MTLLLGLESRENSEAEDEQILRIARSLCEQLNCQRISPQRISWQEQYGYSKDRQGNPIGRFVSSHYPLFWRGVLILNPVLKDRLTIDELRPLIASSVVYYGHLISKLKRRMALLALPVFLVLAGYSLFAFTGGVFPDLFFSFLIFFVALFVPIGFAAYFSRLGTRQFMFRADSRAAELMGARSLLDALRKIQALRDSDEKEDPMSAWAWIDFGTGGASLENRIRNLQIDGSSIS